MKDVLDEWLIITLIGIQPRKEEVAADYIVPSPQMANCRGGCIGTCKTGCSGGCKTTCSSGCKGYCRTGCYNTCKGRSR